MQISFPSSLCSVVRSKRLFSWKGKIYFILDIILRINLFLKISLTKGRNECHKTFDKNDTLVFIENDDCYNLVPIKHKNIITTIVWKNILRE